MFCTTISTFIKFLDNGLTSNPTPNFNSGLAINDIEYNFKDIYLGAHYRLKVGKFTITPGFSLHSYGNNNTQFGQKFKDDFFKIIEVVFDRKLLQDGGLLIIEHSKHKDLSENKYLSFSKKYGGSMFSFYKATEEL